MQDTSYNYAALDIPEYIQRPVTSTNLVIGQTLKLTREILEVLQRTALLLRHLIYYKDISFIVRLSNIFFLFKLPVTLQTYQDCY